MNSLNSLSHSFCRSEIRQLRSSLEEGCGSNLGHRVPLYNLWLLAGFTALQLWDWGPHFLLAAGQGWFSAPQGSLCFLPHEVLRGSPPHARLLSSRPAREEALTSSSTISQRKLSALKVLWLDQGSWRTGKPGALQSMGLQKVRHNWMTEQVIYLKISWLGTVITFVVFFVFLDRVAQHMVSQLPREGLNLCPLQEKHWVLTTGPPEKSLEAHL